MPDLPPVHAGFIIRDITHSPDRPACGGIEGVAVHRPLSLQPGERFFRSQRPGKGSASTPDVAARRFLPGAPARPFDPAAPLRAGPGERLPSLATG